MVVKKVIRSGAKCTCNVGAGLLALILFAVGFWVLINGLVAQWNNAAVYWQVMLWYLGGFVLLALAKMSKWKACADCPVHSMR